MTRLLVTGATGLLGLNLSLRASEQRYTVIGLAHTRKLREIPFELQYVDLLDTQQALNVIQDTKVDAIIHCAAIANINAAEQFPEITQILNVGVPARLAEKAADWQIPFIHISSDAVFDGRTGGYVESDSPNPLSLYARSKLESEEGVLGINPKAMVARVVFFGWSLSGTRSLSEFFFNNLRAGQSVQGFTDTYFSPLYVEDLADLLLEMLARGLSGVYHVTSLQAMSKYTFGVNIAQRFGFDPSLIEPVRAADLDRGAIRSLNLTLKPDKLQADLDCPLPTVDDGIEKLYQRWQEGYPAYLQRLAV